MSRPGLYNPQYVSKMPKAEPFSGTKPQHAHDYPSHNDSAGSKWIKHLTQNRLNTFLGGHFGDVNLSSVLYKASLSTSIEPLGHHKPELKPGVSLQVWSAPGLTKPSFDEAMKLAEGKWKTAHKGESFGPSWSNHWWKIDLVIPRAWQGEQVVWCKSSFSSYFIFLFPQLNSTLVVRPWYILHQDCLCRA